MLNSGTNFINTFGLAGCLGLAAVLRLIPFHYSKHLGVDNWFWRLYIETYQKKKEFPVKLNSYLLEIEEQWYPPLFPFLLVKLPQRVLERFGNFISITVDLLTLAFLYLLILKLTENPWFAMLAGFIYALTPVLVSYNIQLNPRGIGNLFLIIVMLALYKFQSGGAFYWIIVILFVGGLILLTHKMTTQLMWFIFLIWGVLYKNWFYFLAIPGTIVVAFIISKGFYWKVLKAHWDIVSFWHRNKSYLGSHQFYNSQIYKKDNFQLPYQLHRPGIKGVIHHLKFIIGFNPFIVFLPYFLVNIGQFYEFQYFLLLWVFLIYVWVFSTSFIGPLKCLGAGNLYTFNSVFPLSMLIGSAAESSFYFLGLMILGTSLSLFSLKIIYNNIRTSPIKKLDQSLEAILYRIKNLPKDNIMCFPIQMPDIVAYKTGKKVLWGGHSYGFKMLEPIFPVLKMRLGEVVKKYGINYILLFKEYLPDFENFSEKELSIRKLEEDGEYVLYEVN